MWCDALISFVDLHYCNLVVGRRCCWRLPTDLWCAGHWGQELRGCLPDRYCSELSFVVRFFQPATCRHDIMCWLTFEEVACSTKQATQEQQCQFGFHEGAGHPVHVHGLLGGHIVASLTACSVMEWCGFVTQVHLKEASSCYCACCIFWCLMYECCYVIVARS